MKRQLNMNVGMDTVKGKCKMSTKQNTPNKQSAQSAPTAQRIDETTANSTNTASANEHFASTTEAASATSTTETANAASTTGSANANASTTDAFEEMPEEEILYELADLFKALSDTTRIRILYLLLGREFCVADIEHALGVSQSAVSHQLRLLKQAHLVKFRRDGKNIVYSLADDHVYTMIAQGMTHICE